MAGFYQYMCPTSRARDRWISSTIPFGGRIGESREAFPRSKDLQETRESLMAYMTCHVRSTCGRAFPSHRGFLTFTVGRIIMLIFGSNGWNNLKYFKKLSLIYVKILRTLVNISDRFLTRLRKWVGKRILAHSKADRHALEQGKKGAQKSRQVRRPVCGQK